MTETLLEARNITKTFPGVVALDDVSFDCQRGEVHALVGENGAGKSTLVKIFSGALLPDKGEIIWKGSPVSIQTPSQAQAMGISIIYQEFNLVPEMTVAENIFLGAEPGTRLGLIDQDRLHQEAQQLLDGLDISLDLKRRISRLGVAEQQMVEITKALRMHADLIIMDEPSAVLAGDELDHLFANIRHLKDRGVGVIYISHRIDEVFQIADRVTVLKDGKFMGTVSPKETTKGALIRMMIGRTLEETFPESEFTEGEVVLSVVGLSREGAFRDVTIELRKGEIVGLFGLVGSGRTGLAKTIFGAEPAEEGQICLNGALVRMDNPRRAVTSGLALLPEDRKAEGLILRQSVRRNVSLAILDKIQGRLFLRENQEQEIVQQAIDDLSIQTPNQDQEVYYLSGGNQQKTCLAKWLATAPQVIILDEPTRGIDVGAKAEIYRLMRQLAGKGTAILMISSELPEILGMSDRVLVMHEGQIMGELSPGEATEEKVMTLATGNALEEEPVAKEMATDSGR